MTNVHITLVMKRLCQNDLLIFCNMPDTIYLSQYLLNAVPNGNYNDPYQLVSQNGLYSLVLQQDAQLVGYTISNNTSFWSSGSGYKAGTSGDVKLSFTAVSGDPVYLTIKANSGNLQVTPGWGAGMSTKTNRLVLQNDRNICAYDTNNNCTWSTNTSV